MHDFYALAKDMDEELVAWRRSLHGMPELGLDLPRTVAFIEGTLAGMGIRTVRRAGGGLVASIGSGKRAFLLRADMDALPMREASGLPFSASGEAAHTCGHDLHAAMLLGAAKLLRGMETELGGEVRLVFQAAEETGEGAAAMIEAGALAEPRPEAALALHVFPGVDEPGALYWAAGPVLASSDAFEIRIVGKAGHGAIPQAAIDPVLAACHVNLALQSIRTREVDPQEALVISVCSINAGQTHNAIPDRAALTGSIRAFSEETRRFAKERLAEIARSCSRAFRAECSVVFSPGLPATVNDARLAETLEPFAASVAGRLIPFPRQMGSEDFSRFGASVPAVFAGLCAGGPEPEYSRAGSHNPGVVFNEAALAYGSAVLAASAYGYLGAPPEA